MDEKKLKLDTLKFFIEDKNHSTFHDWSDKTVDWESIWKMELEVIDVVRHAHLCAMVKEKYGSIRLYFIYMFDGTLKSWIQPSCRRDFDCYIYSEWAYEHWPSLYNFLLKKLTPALNKVLAFISELDRCVAFPHIPFYYEFVLSSSGEKPKHPVLYRINEWIKKHITIIPKRFIKWVNNKQMERLNIGYQKIAMKYPNLVNELLTDCDLYKCIHPVGDYIVDGETIHKKYWKTIKTEDKK